MRVVFLLAGLAACASREIPREGPREVSPAAAPRDAALRDGPATDAAAKAVALDTGAPASPAGPMFEAVVETLFVEAADIGRVRAACPETLAVDARVRCAHDERYRGDASAAGLAYELWAQFGIVAGVETAHVMAGGYRGHIRIVPAVPMGDDRKHLAWILQAVKEIDAVFVALARRGPAPTTPAVYRYKPLTLRFMRSVAARTPSAYASGWMVAWNLDGSLHTSAEAARDTLVHEIFHLNDQAHGSADDAWSEVALGATFDAVTRKCGVRTACLATYSPNDTQVRGGTYYSFQPGNGVREYAAELALRYFREQRAVLHSLPAPRSFKCGPAENARSWASVRDEFFAGRDLVPAC